MKFEAERRSYGFGRTLGSAKPLLAHFALNFLVGSGGEPLSPNVLAIGPFECVSLGLWVQNSIGLNMEV